MREIKSIDPQKWLSLVNSEADPTLDTFNIQYVSFNNHYAVVIESGYGTFVSKLVNNPDQLPELEKTLVERFNTAKAGANIFNPKVGTSLVQ